MPEIEWVGTWSGMNLYRVNEARRYIAKKVGRLPNPMQIYKWQVYGYKILGSDLMGHIFVTPNA